MTEKELQKTIVDAATFLGWHVAHFRPAKTAKGWRTPMQGNPGFPDLVLARRGRVIFAELKTENGKLSDEQRGWIGELGWGGCETWIVRPSGLDDFLEILR